MGGKMDAYGARGPNPVLGLAVGISVPAALCLGIAFAKLADNARWRKEVRDTQMFRAPGDTPQRLGLFQWLQEVLGKGGRTLVCRPERTSEGPAVGIDPALSPAFV
jgi:hypothetical protein